MATRSRQEPGKSPGQRRLGGYGPRGPQRVQRDSALTRARSVSISEQQTGERISSFKERPPAKATASSGPRSPPSRSSPSRPACAGSFSLLTCNLDSLRSHGLYSPWNSPDQKTGVGSLSLLQAIFPTQGSNPGLQHCRWILYQPSHKGSPIYHGLEGN